MVPFASGPRCLITPTLIIATEYDWSYYSVYGPSHEETPQGMPIPHGEPAKTTTFEDANLMHDLTTGRSATGVIHLVNQTHIAARIASTEQIMDL
jgi:hypothetical protein